MESCCLLFFLYCEVKNVSNLSLQDNLLLVNDLKENNTIIQYNNII